MFQGRPPGPHQILAAASPNGGEIGVADDAAVEDPDPTRLAVLALDHPHHRFERGHIGTVAVKCFVAEGEAVDIDDHGQDDLQAIGPMIATIAAPHHRILRRGAFHVTAREVVQQDVELRREQLAVARREMALECGLLRQQVIQRAIEPGVIDRALGNMQQIVERRRRIPPLFNGQLASGRAESIDREDRGDARPRHVGGDRIQPRLEELVQPQLPPERQAEQRGPQLPRPLQPDTVDQDVGDLRVISGRREVRGKQFQLVPFAGVVEDLDRLQPPRLRRVIQLAEMTQRPLPRSIRRAHRFDERPIGVPLAIFVTVMRTQKHAGRWSHARSPAARG